MKKLVIIFGIIFLQITTAFAQSMYEYCYTYTYAGGYTENYKALIVRNEDGQGFIRIKFTYPKDNIERLFDLEMKEYYGTTNTANGQVVDDTKIVLDGYDPELIRGPAYTFYNECFLLEYDFNQQQYIPTGVRREVRNNNGNFLIYGTINYIRPIDEKDMTKEFVQLYFDEQDEIYQNLFNQQSLVNETRGMTVPTNAVKMNLIFVANTNDGKIGKTCEIDKDKITARLSSIAKWLKIGFNRTVIAGNDYNVNNVINAVNNVPMGANDICIFYYSGHGFNSNQAKEQYPFLDLRENDMDGIDGNALNIEAIYKSLVAKNYRLTLVVSDCCNNDIGLTMVPSKTEITMRPSTTSFSLRNGIDLFLNKERKSYLFTASSKGELSAGNGVDGGIFSHNFRETLEYYLGNFKSNVSWDQIWKVAKDETIKKALNSDCFSRQTNTTYKCRQTPVSPIDRN